MRDPFDGGEPRTGSGDKLEWWKADAPGLRIVGRVDGVFEGKKMEFAKLTGAVVFNDRHEPLRQYDLVAMTTYDCTVHSTDAGAIVVVDCVGWNEKDGRRFPKYATRVLTGADRERAMGLLARARAKLADVPPANGGADELPF